MREARIVTEIVEENIKVSAFILQEHKTYLYLINVDKLDGLNSTDYIFAFFQYGKTPYEQKRELLDYLATRPKSDYNKFIQCLADDNQRDAAKEFALPGFEPKPPQPEPSFGEKLP